MKLIFSAILLTSLAFGRAGAAEYDSLHEVLRHFQVAFVERANPTALYTGALSGLKKAAPKSQITFESGGAVKVRAGKKEVLLPAAAMRDFRALEKGLCQAADVALAGGAAKKALWLERNMIRSMVAHCGDPWSVFLAAELYVRLLDDGSKQMGSIGLLFESDGEQLRVLDVVEASPAAKAGIRPGQEVKSLVGKPAAGLNEIEALALVRGAVGENVQIEVGGFAHRLKLAPEPKKNISVNVLGKGYALVKLYNFRDGTGRRLGKVIQQLGQKIDGGLKGLVLDLRGNPGGLVSEASQVVGLFTKAGTVVQVISKKHMQTEVERSQVDGPYRQLPLVILADHRSGSVSEIVIMALRDKERAKVVGTKTLGKGTVQVVMELMDGSAIKLSTGRYYSPKGSPLYGGLEPDYRVDWKGQGKDPQLGKALDLLSR